MTCGINEAVVLNTKSNKELFEDHEVIALKADKGKIPDAVAEILIELGNPSQAYTLFNFAATKKRDCLLIVA